MWDTIVSFFQEFWNNIVEFFNKNGQDLFQKIILALVVFLIGHFLIKFIAWILRKIFNVNVHYHKVKIKKSDKEKGVSLEKETVQVQPMKDKSASNFLISLVVLILRVILFFGILSILSVPLDSFVSLLSAGVLAIGVSLQNVIGNFASGVIILTTHPFHTGDYISLSNGAEGTVAEIRMMSCLLDTPDNQRVVVNNSAITSSNITNYSIHDTRRIDLTLTFEMDCNPEDIRHIVMEHLNANEKILKDPASVVIVKGFSDSATLIGVRCWVKNDDYWDVFFALNEELLSITKESNLPLAYNRLNINVLGEDKK